MAEFSFLDMLYTSRSCTLPVYSPGANQRPQHSGCSPDQLRAPANPLPGSLPAFLVSLTRAWIPQFVAGNQCFMDPCLSRRGFLIDIFLLFLRKEADRAGFVSATVSTRQQALIQHWNKRCNKDSTSPLHWSGCSGTGALVGVSNKYSWLMIYCFF